MIFLWTIARPGLAIRPGMPWLVLVLFLLGLALVGEAYFRSAPPISSRRRLLLASLRFAALLVLMLIILDPTLTLTSGVSEKPKVTVLVDTSRSMGFSDRRPSDSSAEPDSSRTRPRIQRAFEILWGPPRGLIDELKSKAEVRLFQFAEDVAALGDRGTTEAAWVEESGGGDQTNFGRALAKAVEGGGGGRPDAVILLSDGLSNVGKDPVVLASHLGVPVHTVGIGDPNPPKDVAIARCLANEVAYVDSRVEVRVDFAVSGLEIDSVPIRLWGGEDLLDSVCVDVGGRSETRRVSLFFTPAEEGVHRYRVEIPAQKGEDMIENNQRLLVVSVLKNRIKVYHVASRPSWDYAFLNRVLERDASVEVTARVLTPSDATVLPPPGELAQYDVLILGDVSRRHLKGDEADRLVEAVTREGKGLVIFGGRDGLDFRGTPVEEILPLESGAGRGRHLVDTFLPVLTPEGAVHMVTRLESESERNRAAWAELPPLDAMNVLGAPKPGAQRLLVHPSRNDGGEPLAVVTVHRTGAGKCVLISAYTLWRWKFLVAGFGGMGDPYERFWGNVVRWLVSREDLKRVRVASDRHVYRSGEVVVFRAQVYDDLFQPVDGATVVVTLTGKDRTADGRVEEELVLDPVGVGQGHYEGRLPFLPAGDYEVSAEALKGGQDLGKDRTELAVDTYSLEYERTAMGENLMRQVARASGGRYYTPTGADGLVRGMDLEQRWVRRVRELRVSNGALLFVLFAGLLFAEWFMRKRSGLS
ncbi:MAG: hypothetical protein KAW17_05805 [Candidatus Eisenbacteria sp.]|nr:hypothetical protein [Candidatus Eisenbacteria bacterium]